jgi:hypothetical protein
MNSSIDTASLKGPMEEITSGIELASLNYKSTTVHWAGQSLKINMASSGTLVYITMFYQLSRLYSFNNKFGCGRERSWPVLRQCPSIYLRGVRETTKYFRTARFMAGNRTWYVSNTKHINTR